MTQNIKDLPNGHPHGWVEINPSVHDIEVLTSVDVIEWGGRQYIRAPLDE